QYRLHFFHRRTKCLAPGKLKRQIVGVDRVVLAVDQLNLEVNKRIPGDCASGGGILDSLLNRGTPLLRDRSAKDLVYKLKSRPASELTSSLSVLRGAHARRSASCVCPRSGGAPRTSRDKPPLADEARLPRRIASSACLLPPRCESDPNLRAGILLSAHRDQT